MRRSETEALLRRNYQAYADRDIAVIDELASDEVVMHVPGAHPLSGDHIGRAAAWAYLGKAAEVSGGVGGFDVVSLSADDEGHATAILRETTRDFVRPVVHVWRVDGGRVAEFWEVNFDQATEDRFWNNALS